MMGADEGFGDLEVTKTSSFRVEHLKKCIFPTRPTFVSLTEPAPCDIQHINEQESCICPRFKVTGPSVPPSGPLDSPFVFVGRDPGEQEVEAGIPFHPDAPGGGLLVQYFEALGLTRDQVYITNTVFCRMPKNAPPTPEERYKCGRFHQKEFKDLTGIKFIFPLGSDAFQVMTGIYCSITPFVGQYFETSFYHHKDVKIVPLHHPGYILRRPSEREKLFETLREMSGLA